MYILRRPQNFENFPPYFCLQYIQTKIRWRFRKILWPSQNIQTLPEEILFLRSWPFELELKSEESEPDILLVGVMAVFPLEKSQNWELPPGFTQIRLNAISLSWACDQKEEKYVLMYVQTISIDWKIWHEVFPKKG